MWGTGTSCSLFCIDKYSKFPGGLSIVPWYSIGIQEEIDSLSREAVAPGGV